MRSGRVFAWIVALAIGLGACGKYGPPERSAPLEPTAPPEAVYPEPGAPEETVAPPVEFENSEAQQENDQ